MCSSKTSVRCSIAVKKALEGKEREQKRRRDLYLCINPWFYLFSNISGLVFLSQNAIGEPDKLEEEVAKVIAGKECFPFR